MDPNPTGRRRAFDRRAVRSPLLPITTVLLVALLSATAVAPSPPALSLRSANLPSGISSQSPASSTHPTGNFTIPIPNPGFLAYAGETLGMQYELEVPAWVPADGAFAINVPGSKAVFYYGTNSSTMTLFESRQNVTISSAGNTTAHGVTLQLSGNTQFNGSQRAVFSTNLLSLMTPFPDGTLSASARWQWYVLAPDGSADYGPWSSWVATQPAQYAWLTQTSGSLVALNGSYEVCLSGPLQGRNISLHIEVPSPLDDFSKTTKAVPPTWAGPFCLSTPMNATLPDNLTPPQGLLVHVWDYQNSSVPTANHTFLLYVINIQCVAVLPQPPSSASGSVPLYVEVAGVGATVTLALVAVTLLAMRRKRRRNPPAKPPTDSVEPQTGSP